MPWRWSSPLTTRSADNSYRTFAGGLHRDNHAGFIPNYLANYFWIALGAVVGASARYFLSTLVARNLSSAFPYGTLLVNVTGSLVLGFFLVFSTDARCSTRAGACWSPSASAVRTPRSPATHSKASPSWSRDNGF